MKELFKLLNYEDANFIAQDSKFWALDSLGYKIWGNFNNLDFIVWDKTQDKVLDGIKK